MSEKKEKTISRRHYRKPKLEQVQLLPEEAVLTACKQPNNPCQPGSKTRGS